MPSDPSFVLVQVEGAEKRLRSALNRAHEDWELNGAHLGESRDLYLVEHILSALGLDRPGVSEMVLESVLAGAIATSKRLGGSAVIEACTAEVRAALAAAKEVGDG